MSDRLPVTARDAAAISDLLGAVVGNGFPDARSIALHLGVSPSLVSLWGSGERTMPVHCLRAIFSAAAVKRPDRTGFLVEALVRALTGLTGRWVADAETPRTVGDIRDELLDLHARTAELRDAIREADADGVRTGAEREEIREAFRLLRREIEDCEAAAFAPRRPLAAGTPIVEHGGRAYREYGAGPGYRRGGE